MASMKASDTSAVLAPPTPQDAQRYQVLVEFAHRHLDFQLAELASVLQLFDLELNSPDCQVVALPDGVSEWHESNHQQQHQQHQHQQEQQEQNLPSLPPATTKTTTKRTMRTQRSFIVLSFPTTNKRVMANNNNKSNNNNKEKSATTTNVVSNLQGIGEMLSRCTLVRSVVELWGASTTIPACAQQVKNFVHTTVLGKQIFRRMSDESQSWKMTIHTLGTKYTREEQNEMRNHFSTIGFTAPVKMKDPQQEYIMIREIEMNRTGCPLFPRFSEKKELIVRNDARPALAVYFGRVLSGMRNSRDGIDQYSLKKRIYLGPTSMDAELSFIMSSLGMVRQGSVVFDPFVGTGSILLSCALRGAYCVGADIDIRVLRGKGKDKTIYSNFEQYDLRRPELIRSDNAIYHRHYRHHAPYFDAIICDPPYGIRAGARKTGSKKDLPRVIPEEHRHDHIPQTKPYAVSDVMSDLLDVAARTLVMHGRLVYVIPSFRQFDPDTDLPRHECLKLLHSCYQPLSPELGRRIVAMRKVKEYDPSKRDAYLSSVWVNGAESAEKCANIREKIMEAAKQKPGYDEKLAIRKRKRKATKEAKKSATIETNAPTPAIRP